MVRGTGDIRCIAAVAEFVNKDVGAVENAVTYEELEAADTRGKSKETPVEGAGGRLVPAGKLTG